MASLVSKLAARFAQNKLRNLLAPPLQLGVGVPNGCEAIIHSVTRLVDDFGKRPGKAVIKVDFSNAFNFLCRRVFLKDIASHCPEIYPWVKRVYCMPSIMFAGDKQLNVRVEFNKVTPWGPFFLPLVFMTSFRTWH